MSDIISNLTSGAIYDGTLDFWNSITAPPMLSLLSPYDVATIDDICRDPKLITKLDKKYEYFNQILEPRGFTKLTQGTNRAVYRFREDESFIIKIATSQAGLQDSPAEFRNQQLYLPDIAKCFEVTPSGTIGMFERVKPIKSKEQLLSIIDEVYLFYNRLFRKHPGYVMADIGVEFYKNLGIRENFGVVLLDYPLLYKIDKNKLFCDKIDRFGHMCGGQIDYDDGYNFLKCTRCGKQYLMKKLAIDSGTIEEYVTKFVKRKEVTDMKVHIMRGDEVVCVKESMRSSDFIDASVAKKNKIKKQPFESKLKVEIIGLEERRKGVSEMVKEEPTSSEPVLEEVPQEELFVPTELLEDEPEDESFDYGYKLNPDDFAGAAPFFEDEKDIKEEPVETVESEKEETTKSVEEEPVESEASKSEIGIEEERNPFVDRQKAILIEKYQKELDALGIKDLDYEEIIIKSDFDLDCASYLIDQIIETAQDSVEKASNTNETKDTGNVQNKPESEFVPRQRAPFPRFIDKPIHQTNFTLNMEEEDDLTNKPYNNSRDKYPAKKVKKGKNSRRNFDNY